jgi:hypothetical protein
MPFYYTFEMHQNKLSNEGILLKLLTGKEMHTNLEYVPIPIKEYEQMQIDILQYKNKLTMSNMKLNMKNKNSLIIMYIAPKIREKSE